MPPQETTCRLQSATAKKYVGWRYCVIKCELM